MKKLFIILALFCLLPPSAFAYDSNDVVLPMGARHHVFSDGHPWTGYWASDIHLVSDMKDFCVQQFRMQPSYTMREQDAATSTFNYSGGFLLFTPDGDLIPTATTTLFGKSYWTPWGQSKYSVNTGYGYCTTGSQFDFALGIISAGEPAKRVYFGWDTPTNTCRTGGYTLSQCIDAGAYVSRGFYYYYGNKGTETSIFNGMQAAALTAFTGPPAKPWSVYSSDFQIGLPNGSVAGWMGGKLILLLGSGLGLLVTIWPYVLAVAFIFFVVIFIWRAWKFFHQ